jgi:hypothetical protein
MSSPCPFLRRCRARPARRGDWASGRGGHGLPIARRLGEPMFLRVVAYRQPGRRPGRTDLVVADGPVGTITPHPRADRSIRIQRRLIRAIPPCQRLSANGFDLLTDPRTHAVTAGLEQSLEARPGCRTIVLDGCRLGCEWGQEVSCGHRSPAPSGGSWSN